MTITVILGAVLLAAAPAHAERGYKVVGGVDATQLYPAQAEIEVDLGLSGELCGGTLIASQWVLTAGHCATDQATGGQLPPGLYTVRLGSNRLGAGQAFAVDAIHRAPGYDNTTLANDAALLHLTAPASQAPLPLIDAATLSAADPGVRARVLGWGYTSENGAISRDLQQVDVPIVSDERCAFAYPGVFQRTSMVCAGEAAGGRDACQGDSGGPLMVPAGGGYLLAGIVSTGDGCGQPGKYGVYARLASEHLRAFVGGFVPEVAAAQQAATTRLATPPAIRRLRDCSRTRCRAAVRFAAGGQVRAVLSVSRGGRRRLGLPRRRLALRDVAAVGSSTASVDLAVRRSVRRAIRRSGRRTARAKLNVVAQTSSGLRASDSRRVTLRR